ncbi:DUF1624 domain-containing protein [Shewanella sp. WXL01]|uniref:DUF1624 domain-containing protein n=1 Tax=Shewanella maritima TaxID=2520507 RepID=A0A411PJS6_9GAMM|nr:MULTISPECIES: heparan-alpha-glucosaminide N-acetyltransferase domain-containing protein [Shewanella]NKF50824.1 DUF1624 domain-containing protein [Shewanella sp. WXL01]QBF83809.1 DUF1624 domain-containing protein [Shewanella maritima]
MTQQELKRRIASIDILRGIVIVLMLVDHVRERFFLHVQVSDPMDINTTTPELFFTRLSAHFCAPIFVFLTGLSAWLYANPVNGKPRSAQDFLLKRGLILILLEATVINFSWFGYYETLYLQVIWAIGLSMIALAFLSKLPRVWVGMIGLLIVFGHNLLTPIQFAPNEWGYSLWTILHDRGYLISEGALKIRISYPVLPWIGVIMVGWALGPLFSPSVASETRRKQLLMLGLASLGTLAILRGFNLYGETLPWASQGTMAQTVMDMLNFTKYPPSLAFLLLGVGVGLLVLAWLENADNKLLDALNTFGSAPMFFYIIHLYTLLIVYKVAVAIFGTNTQYYGQDYLGFASVWQVWLCAFALTFVLYWPTKTFAAFKRRTNIGWVKYF